jgi:hypothetical protein
MSQTMLQLVQQVTSELNLAIPTYVAGNPSQDVQQVLALMNGAGYDLVKEYDWQALAVPYRFYTQYVNTTGSCVQNGYTITNVQSFVAQDGTDIDSTYQVTGNSFPQDTQIVSINKTAKTVTVNQKCSATQVDQSVLFSKTEYDLPPDYDTITDRTQWDKSKHWEMLGPEDAQQWQWLKSGYISTGPRIRWRITGGTFQTWPPMNTQEYLGFEYRSKGWARSSTGDIKNSFTQDTDTTIFDDRLMTIYTKLKYFQIKSFDTTSLQQDYQRYLSVIKAADKGSPNLSFAPYPARVLIGWANIPDTGYGS